MASDTIPGGIKFFHAVVVHRNDTAAGEPIVEHAGDDRGGQCGSR